MKTTSRLTTWMAQGAIGLALGLGLSASAVDAAAVHQFRDARLDGNPPATVALLPVATLDENGAVERFVEDSWTDFYAQAGPRWLASGDVRSRLAVAGSDAADLLARADEQIWKHAEVDAEVAVRLARLLGVDAVLSVRIGRWQIVDGFRASVEMTAVLTGADGERLWYATGGAGCGVPRGSVASNFSSDLTRIWSPQLEPPDHATDKLACALRTLLARWEETFPTAPLYAGRGTAGTSDGVSLD